MTTTDFGFEQVRVEEKARLVGRVFTSVASRYDLMNDLMSAGSHRLWKHFAVELAGIRSGQDVLDVAGGTGDITARLLQRVGPEGRVVLTDINGSMLGVGRERLLDRGHVGNVVYAQANAECLPFADNSFDAVTIAFGLRNVTDKDRALRSMYRVLRPGGRLVVLEFSHVVLPFLSRLYDLYSFNVVPPLGAWITGDRGSYQYLVESIRRHPNQETLKGMLEAAGFELTDVHNLSGGIVAVHRGYKL
jgi:demethylmenaquinone methyltransferase / 2-methoxy-6-polyprenyl-1,4-benzoquinol methylase